MIGLYVNFSVYYRESYFIFCFGPVNEVTSLRFTIILKLIRLFGWHMILSSPSNTIATIKPVWVAIHSYLPKSSIFDGCWPIYSSTINGARFWLLLCTEASFLFRITKSISLRKAQASYMVANRAKGWIFCFNSKIKINICRKFYMCTCKNSLELHPFSSFWMLRLNWFCFCSFFSSSCTWIFLKTMHFNLLGFVAFALRWLLHVLS